MKSCVPITMEISNPETCNKEQQMLSSYIKNVHLSLRKTASKIGAEKAWQDHCNNKEHLAKYAKYMEKLATEHWTDNNEGSLRISWAAEFCKTYFIDKMFLSFYDKEKAIAAKIDISLLSKEKFDDKVNLLDVGSCYNPFKEYKTFMNVTAIDLCPANASVKQCDFLEVAVGNEISVRENKIIQLEQESFEAVVFSFLLEYIPISELRISACIKAYSLLKPGGLLLISTPDSKHVGANAKLMKCWRYTLAQLGFTRIQYNKFKFIHSMAFRKTLVKDVATRWALLHKEPYMEFALHIPQDFNTCSEENNDNSKPIDSILSHCIDLDVMPFSESDVLFLS